jgi:cystathionine beta-lyase
MEKYDFNAEVDRHGTSALKVDALQERYGHADLIPLWVADMDFPTPPFVVDAIRRIVEPGAVLGYAVTPPDYWATVSRWIAEHHGWEVNPEWMTFIPGIVKGIGMAINVFVKADEKVIIQPPVYHPFRLTPLGNRREVVYNPLRENPDGSYSMDFDHLAKVADEKCRMLILCNPHNPGGILWDRATLQRLASFCCERGIIVVSDEIHCDMALWGKKHIPFASVSPEAARCSITFGAPSKTFNMAGVVSSYAVVSNPELRIPFFNWLTANELNEPTIFATEATMAAFTQGEEWRRQMLAYIEDNVRFVEQFCAEHIPAIKPWRPQASFLVWLDCRELHLTQQQLVDLFIEKAGLALNDGAMFGTEGTGFMRLNVGSPRSIIARALHRLAAAL